MGSPFLQLQSEEAAIEKVSENMHYSLVWSRATQAKYQISHIIDTTGSDGVLHLKAELYSLHTPDFLLLP